MRLSLFVAALVMLILPATGMSGELKDSVRQQMELLASKGLNEALTVIQDKGAIYPFGMLLEKDESVRLVGYSGKDADKPPADQYVGALVKQLHDMSSIFLNVQVAAVFKMHAIKTKDGKTIPGIWILVDHREGRPLIIFQPLIQGSRPNQFSLGPQLFEAASESIFEHEAE